MKFSVLALAATAAALPAYEMARASNTTLESLDKRVSKLERGMMDNNKVLTALRDAVAQLGGSQPAVNAKMVMHHGKHHPAAATSTGATETATPIAGAGAAVSDVALNETAGKYAMHNGHSKGHGKGNGYESPPILPESLASGDAVSSPTPVAAIAEDWEMKHGKHKAHQAEPLESGDAASTPTPVADTGVAASDVVAAQNDMEMMHDKRQTSASPSPTSKGMLGTGPKPGEPLPSPDASQPTQGSL